MTVLPQSVRTGRKWVTDSLGGANAEDLRITLQNKITSRTATGQHVSHTTDKNVNVDFTSLYTHVFEGLVNGLTVRLTWGSTRDSNRVRVIWRLVHDEQIGFSLRSLIFAFSAASQTRWIAVWNTFRMYSTKTILKASPRWPRVSLAFLYIHRKYHLQDHRRPWPAVQAACKSSRRLVGDSQDFGM